MGKRVLVALADGSWAPGELLGYVTVHAWLSKAGDLLSLSDAEEEPNEQVRTTMEVEGAEEELIEYNPKIRLQDGSIVYGCQVWWKDQEN